MRFNVLESTSSWTDNNADVNRVKTQSKDDRKTFKRESCYKKVFSFLFAQGSKLSKDKKLP